MNLKAITMTVCTWFLKRNLVTPWLVGMAFVQFVAQVIPADADSITLVPEEQYQVMQGWEATPELSDTPAHPQWGGDLETLLDRAVSEVGLNRIRLEIVSGAETRNGRSARFLAGDITYPDYKTTRYHPTNDNDDPMVIDHDGFDFSELDWTVETFVLPVAERLRARGERLFVNLCYVSFRDGTYLHRDPEEYAELVLATHLHLDAKYGIRPDSWEVILEPDLPTDGWTGSEIGAAIVASARRLEAHGFDTRFNAPSVTNLANAAPYLKDILAVPGAREHMAEVSYHRYEKATRRRVEQLATLADRNGLATSMLEWWFGKGTYQVLHEDLKVGNVAAWQGRSLLNHFKGYPTAGPDAPIRPDIVFNSLYFRSIRLGAQRIGAKTNLLSALDPVAFIGPDGEYVVMAMSRRMTEVKVIGLPPGVYKLSIVTEDRITPPDRTLNHDGDGPMVFEMPARGILAIRGI